MWDGTEIEIVLTLIRHGETESNRLHRYLGKTEESLSEEGRQRLLKIKQSRLDWKTDYLFSGPMLRCRQTVEMLFPEKEPVWIPEWTEMDFGRFEGKNYEELRGDVDYQAWIDSGGRLPFPGGESREAFIKRTKQGFFRMLEIVSADGQSGVRSVTAVVHGGTIMALCSTFSGGEYFDFQVKNGGGYVCRLRCQKEKINLLEIEKL